MSDQRYNQRGVSASKEDVHNAIKNIDKGIFPKAFCKIIPDVLGGDPEYCNISLSNKMELTTKFSKEKRLFISVFF
jgi:hypothetical protein